MTPRLLLSLSLILTLVASARAVEPWADPKMPVTEGLELWLDATRIDAAAKYGKEKLAADGKLAVWFDGSGKARHVRQGKEAARPTASSLG